MLKALAREPAERFQSASEFAAALAPFTTSEAGSFSAAELAKVMHREFSDALAGETERLRKLAKVRELPLPGPGTPPAAGAPAPNAAVAPPAVAPIAGPPQGSDAGLRPVDSDRRPEVGPGITETQVRRVSSRRRRPAARGRSGRAHRPVLRRRGNSSASAATSSASEAALRQRGNFLRQRGNFVRQRGNFLRQRGTSLASAALPSSDDDEDGPDPAATATASTGGLTPSSAADSTPAFGVGAHAPVADRRLPRPRGRPDRSSAGAPVDRRSAPVEVEADSFDLSEGLPRAFADEDEDDDPEDRTQVISPAVMEATLESAVLAVRRDVHAAEGASSLGGVPLGTGRPRHAALRRSAGAGGHAPRAPAELVRPRPSRDCRTRHLPGNSPPPGPRRPPAAGQPIGRRRDPRERASPPSPSPKTTDAPESPAPARPLPEVTRSFPAARPSTANRPAVGAPARTADREPASPGPPFPDRSHPAFDAAARASEPGRQGPPPPEAGPRSPPPRW